MNIITTTSPNKDSKEPHNSTGQEQLSSVGILFGSFNPPHTGHINAIINAKNNIGFDEAWMVPTRQSPLKQHIEQAILPHKLAMCRIMARPHKGWLQVKNLLKVDNMGYTGTLCAAFNMASSLTREYPETRFHIIGGSDNGLVFRLFVYSLRLSATIESLRLAPRTALRKGLAAAFGHVAHSARNYHLVKLKRNENDAGSTDIRKHLAATGKHEACPAPLAVFIKRHAMYQCPDTQKQTPNEIQDDIRNKIRHNVP